jgi:hypothetical protein
MKTKIIFYLTTVMVFGLLNIGLAQNNYADFKTFFKPTKHLFSPDNIIVYDFQTMGLAKQINTLESYINKGDLKSFSLIIISIDRNLAGTIIDRMPIETALKGLNFLAEKWALDVVYFISEKTYNNLADLTAIKNFKIVSSLK